ncbi:MAG TPA: L-lactate permease [Symbiobacteriaceae bacterium]|jgi:lactate permease
MQYFQNYNPLGNVFLSTIVAAIPLLTLLYLLALHPWRDENGNQHRGIEAPKAAGIAAIIALIVAMFVLKMPFAAAGAAFVYGAASGLFPIGWIVVAAMFLYQMTLITGKFDVVKESVARISNDRRLQVLLIAFSFGAFLEGAAGFGTPVAIAGALLVGLGFKPFQSAVLNLLANTAPVAFGAIGTPVITLAAVTGINPNLISAMAGRQLPFFSLIVPLYVIVVMVKMDKKPMSKVWEVWPAIVVSGASFAVTQWYVSNYMGPNLVDILGGLVSMFCLAGFSLVWKPKTAYDEEGESGARKAAAAKKPYTTGEIISAWVPWILLTIFVFLWGYPSVKAWLNLPHFGIKTVILQNVPFLHKLVMRTAPVVVKPTAEGAVYTINWLQAAGSGIFIAAILSGLWMGMTGAQWKSAISRTASRMKVPLLTIGTVLGFSYMTRYAGTDAILGLAFTRTGVLYPLFAAMLGWLGVFLTGSDTASNAMFGSLQQITAQQLGLSQVLIVTANSTGGVMGKMIDAQSIVVATASTYENPDERKAAVGPIFRFVFWHSLFLAFLVGLVVLAQAYWLTWMIPH